MANNQYINKVVYGNQVLLDLTSDTIEADKILRGYTAHKANGEPIVGTYEGGGEGYTINLTASSSELYGQDIVVSYEGQRVTTIQFSNLGTASIVVQEEGAYNFAVSYGGLTYYCDVNVVSAIVTYNETIYYYPNGSTVTPVNDVQIWISCANVRDKNYTTLAEVLADVQLLATLMSSENAVNYLVRSKQFIGNVALVPTMTSNTTPSGEASASSVTPYHSNSLAFKAFDGNDSTEWWSDTAHNEWVKYRFSEAVYVSGVTILPKEDSGHSRVKNFKIQGSNDNFVSDTHDIYTGVGEDVLTAQSFTFPNTEKYSSIRLYVVDGYATGNIAIYTLQFSFFGICQSSNAMTYIGANDYCTNTLLADSDWREAICNSEYFESVLNTKVPTMTSNTTPSGEAIGTSFLGSGNQYYNAFDGDDSTTWQCAGGENTPAYSGIGYKFPFAVEIYLVKGLGKPNRSSTEKVQGSNDGFVNDIHDLTNDQSIPANSQFTFFIQNVGSYQSYRLYGQSNTSGTGNEVPTLQFYGRTIGGVQTWLHLAGITDKTYTTLSEVFADSATLSALMANHDAVDYLVTCKGWVTEVCSNQSAMSYIGLNNYCANTLLADETWNEAICNSTYFESVLNVKVPTMTSYTTPEGVVSASSENSAGRPAWWAFDKTMSNNWVSRDNVTTNQWIRYKFTTELSVNKVEIYSTNRVKNFIVQCSNDNFVNDSHDIYSGVCANNTVVTKNTFNFVGTSDRYMYWQVLVQNMYSSAQYPNISIEELQFYGRKDV